MSEWLFFTEITLAGLGSGGLYALTGLAFVLIYKATRVVNLAIGGREGCSVMPPSPAPIRASG